MVKKYKLFSQFLQFVPKNVFAGTAKKTQWGQQSVAMLFCVMGKAQSLREISDGLEGKLRHFGIMPPKKNSLAYANQHRPWEKNQETFFHILSFGTR